MGKTKTAVLTETQDTDSNQKPSYDKAAKEAKRKAREAYESGSTVKVKQEEKVETKKQKYEAPPAEETNVEESSSPNEPQLLKQPKTRSKKYKDSVSKIDKNREYALSEAITLVKESCYCSFDATMEVHLVIKKTGFSVNLTLPHSFGKKRQVEVADDKTIEKLKSGKIDFDVLLATADMMPKLVPFARLLGPKGMMPNPKNGTLIKSAKDADSFSTSATTVKTEKSAPVIHMGVGKLSQDDKDINENIEAVLNAVNKRQVQKMYLSSTMSPSVKVKVIQ